MAKLLKLSEADLALIQEKHNRAQYGYRLAWARSYLKLAGYVDNTERGVWSLTAKGKATAAVNKDEVNRLAKAEQKKQKQQNQADEADEDDELEGGNWKDSLIKAIKNIEPGSF